MFEHRARKRFGQNFLRDQSVINNIISAARIDADDHFLEIGAGTGALTEPLLARLKQLEVVEIDRDLVAKLPQLANAAKLIIHEADALKFGFESPTPRRIIGNLPYNISSPLIFHLLKFNSSIIDMHFMLQKEMVERLAAAPHSRAYGRISVMVQASAKVEMLFTVPPTAFVPAPKVDSAVVRLRPYQTPKYPIAKPDVFANIVLQAFAMRRKTLRNNLKGILSAADFLACDIDPAARAETLSVADFVKLANYHA